MAEETGLTGYDEHDTLQEDGCALHPSPLSRTQAQNLSESMQK